jgi:hypothetical protein
LAIADRSSGVRASARDFPPFKPPNRPDFALTDSGFSSHSPVDRSTIILANWLTSRGLLGICSSITNFAQAYNKNGKLFWIMDEPAQTILRVFAKYEDAELKEEVIREESCLDALTFNYYFADLYKNRYITRGYSYPDGYKFFLTQAGRKWIIDNPISN